MLVAGAGLSVAVDPGLAAREASAGALGRAGLARADAALVFATPAHAGGLGPLLAAAGKALGTPAAAGFMARTVHALGQEERDRPAVAVLALGGVTGQALLVDPVRGGEEALGAEIAACLDGGPGGRDLVVLFFDPATLTKAPFLEGLARALGPATLVGAGAEATAAHATVWAAGRRAEGGLAALLVRAPRQPRVAVVPSYRRIGSPLAVTRSSGHWILALDGRPALDVYRAAARGRLADDLPRAARVVLLALERTVGHGHWVARSPVGFDARRRALALPEALRPGQRLALVLRDADAARAELADALEACAATAPAAALHLGCAAGGSELFGFAGLEAAYLERAFGKAAVVGASGTCQVAAQSGRPELLTYTGVLALLDPDA